MTTMPQLLRFLLLSLSPFLIMNSNASSFYGTNSTYCPSYNCNGVKIGYPFWTRDINSTHRCGYLPFGVECSSSKAGEPIFRLPNDTFSIIKNIDYANQSLTLVDIDVALEHNQMCPKVRHNITLDSYFSMSYSKLDIDLSFLFNCTNTFLSRHLNSYDLPCFASGANHSYVTIGDELEGVDWHEYCDEKVVATVIKSEFNGVYEKFGEAMNKGFVLDWKPSTWDCALCEANKGRCGFDNGDKLLKFFCICPDDSISDDHCKGSHSSSLDIKIRIGLGAAVIGLLLCCFMITYKTNSIMFIWTWRTLNDKNVEAFILQCGTSSPKRYTYSEVKKMTSSFKHELGRGGYGNVYKRTLKDGHLVAVKVLNPLKGNGEEFMNEVASIGRTSHVNIVKLLGFCYEGRHRALIYDFMPNGSLDTFIYAHMGTGDHLELGVEKLYEVAVGIARGLEYLHHGCNTRILHLDIKPQNILLDDNFCPKVSDFGLAKLYTKEESIMSMLEARGTIGYIAPEVFNKSFGNVSHKSDVYSYGMLVMEIVGGRCCVEVESVHTSDTYFPHLVYKAIEKNEELQLRGPMSPDGNDVVKKMTLVGLWCIQTNPSQRPSMKKVIEMLEGRLEDLEIPPKPFLSSPPRSEATSPTSSISL